MSKNTKEVAKQIKKANNLSNALLSGLLAAEFEGNQRNLKVNPSLKGHLEAVHVYDTEISRLKSLKIGKNSDIIDAKQNCGNQLQITVIEKLLKKTEETLQQHVKFRVPEIVSRDELVALRNQLDLFESIQKQLHNLPSSIEGMQEHLDTINLIHSHHQRISVSVDAAQSKVGDLQEEAVVSSSDVTYFSN